MVSFSYLVRIVPNQKTSLAPWFVVPCVVMPFCFDLRAPGVSQKSFQILDILFFSNLISLFFVGVVLLVAIIGVVKISCKGKGAIRPFH